MQSMMNCKRSSWHASLTLAAASGSRNESHVTQRPGCISLAISVSTLTGRGAAQQCALRLRFNGQEALGEAAPVRMSIHERMPCRDLGEASKGQPERVEIGRDYRCVLEGGGEAWMVFQLTPGTVCSETRFPQSGMDSALELHASPTDERLDYDDDGGPERLASRIKYIARRTTNYFVRISGRSETSAGACEVRVPRLGTGSPRDSDASGHLRFASRRSRWRIPFGCRAAGQRSEERSAAASSSNQAEIRGWP